MSELPEVLTLASQLKVLKGKKVVRVDITQPKCLNTDLDSFTKCVEGSVFKEFNYRGKWLIIVSDDFKLYLNYGMGADILFHADNLPKDKYHLLFQFEDQTSLSIRIHFVGKFDLIQSYEVHKSELQGANADTISKEEFLTKALISKASTKNFLLNQRNVSGIGNFYQHDILFLSRVHPQTKINRLDQSELIKLYENINYILNKSIELRGDAYYLDLFGNKGGYTKQYFYVAYNPNKSCPKCKNVIEKIKTGSTSSFICHKCQALKR